MIVANKESFYEKLGVNRAASQDEIKRAFRKKASSAHPDVGGDKDEMAELNKAYDCLSDPVKRLTYDKGGEEPIVDNLTSEARDLIITKFSSALNGRVHVKSNILDLVRSKIIEDRVKFVKDRDQARKAIELLKERRSDVKLKKRRKAVKGNRRKGSDDNLWHYVIDTKINEITIGMLTFDKNIEICVKAMELLESYDEDKPEQIMGTKTSMIIIDNAFPVFRFGEW